MDNLGLIGHPDRDLISLKEPWEVAYWTKRFNCTHAELVSAVNIAGHAVKNVELHFIIAPPAPRGALGLLDSAMR